MSLSEIDVVLQIFARSSKSAAGTAAFPVRDPDGESAATRYQAAHPR
jgi:hypothetical protein